MSAALALDAADGVIDGRHFGRPIVQAQSQFVGGFPQQFVGAQTFAQPTTVLGGYPSFGGFAQPSVFGQQFVGGASSAALALDAADGVIDGKSFGRPIIQAGGPAFGTQFGGYPVAATQFGGYPQTFGTQFGSFAQPVYGQQFGGFVGGASSAALALDAADGVIDGKSFGRPIIQAGAPAFGTQFGGYPVAATQFGGYPQAFGTQFGGFAQPAVFGGASSAALALDAADGVIDGTSFGRPIVQAGGLVPYTGVQQSFVGAYPSAQYAGFPATQFGAFPATQYRGVGVPVAGYGGAYPAYGSTYGAPVAQYGQFGQQYGGYGGFPQTKQQARANAFAQLDAQDGVMDGKNFGKRISKRHPGGARF